MRSLGIGILTEDFITIKLLTRRDQRTAFKKLFRDIDAAKMRYIRSFKNDGKNSVESLRQTNDRSNPNSYNFPEVEEYFMYNTWKR